jgi:hypothetical protein
MRDFVALNTLADTVPILMPVGTGSWRHNRVALVGRDWHQISAWLATDLQEYMELA